MFKCQNQDLNQGGLVPELIFLFLCLASFFAQYNISETPACASSIIPFYYLAFP